jgi:LysR family nitrogen assimilation transcriptional regulator
VVAPGSDSSIEVGQLLEEALGAPLFERMGHGVVATRAGTYLLEKARRLLREVDEIEKAIRTQVPEPIPILTIGAAPVPGRFVVPYLLKRVAAEGPKVFLHVVTGASSNFEEWLSKGLLDIALTYDFMPRHGYDVRVCAAEETWLFGRKDLLVLDQASAADIARLPMILPDRANQFRKNFDRWMGTQGATLSTVSDVNDHAVLRGCVIEGAGFTVHARDAFDADVAAGILRAVPLVPMTERRLAIVTHKASAKQELVEDVAKRLHDSVLGAIAGGAWSARATPS